MFLLGLDCLMAIFNDNPITLRNDLISFCVGAFILVAIALGFIAYYFPQMGFINQKPLDSDITPIITLGCQQASSIKAFRNFLWSYTH